MSLDRPAWVPEWKWTALLAAAQEPCWCAASPCHNCLAYGQLMLDLLGNYDGPPRRPSSYVRRDDS